MPKAATEAMNVNVSSITVPLPGDLRGSNNFVHNNLFETIAQIAGCEQLLDFIRKESRHLNSPQSNPPD